MTKIKQLKRSLLTFVMLLTGLTYANAQTFSLIPNLNLVANGGFQPMASDRGDRSCVLITSTEMATAGVPNGQQFNFVSYFTNTGPSIAVAGGTVNLYMLNTSNTVYSRGTTWGTAAGQILNGMTQVASSALPFSLGANQTIRVNFNLATFTYTGSAVYFAMEYTNPAGALSATTFTGFVNNTFTGLAVRGQSTTSTAPAVAATSFRPRLNAGFQFNNDLSVSNIYTLGSLPIPHSNPNTIKASVTNVGFNTMSATTATLTVTGANPFSNAQAVPSLAPGATAVVTFTSSSNTVVGTNNISVSIPADDNAANNTNTMTQNITSTLYSYRYPGIPNSGGVGFGAANNQFCGKFNTNTAAFVQQVSVDFTTSALPYRLAIYGDAAGLPGTLLYEDAADRTTAIGTAIITLPSNVAIPAGNFYVSIEQKGATNMGFAYTTETPIRSGSFYFTSVPAGIWTDIAPNNSFRFNITVLLHLPIPPNCATNMSPADLATGVCQEQILTWADGGGFTTGYKITFGTNSPTYNNIENNVDLGNVLSYTPVGGLAPGTTYGWKIEPYNADGSSSCSFQTFTTGATSPLNENFTNVTFPPSCWARQTADWNRNAVSANGVGAGSAWFDFYNVPSATTSELTTLIFTAAPANSAVNFNVAYAPYDDGAAGDYLDQLQILASTDGGLNYSSVVVLNGGLSGNLNTSAPTGAQFVPTSTEWGNKSIAVPTGTNRIKFKAISDFGNDLFIDNVTIGPLILDEAAVTNVYTLGQIPLNFGSNHVVKARVINNGSNTWTKNVTLNITGANSFTDVQSVTLASGASTVVTFAAFTATATGNESVTVSVPADNFNTDNSISVSQDITTKLYSYKYAGPNDGGIGFNGGTGAFVGKFTTSATAIIDTVRVDFTTTNVAYRVGIYDATGPGGIPGTLLYTDATDRFTVAGTASITIPNILVTGDFYVGIRQTSITTPGFAYQAEAPVRPNSFYYSAPLPESGVWTNFDPGTNFRMGIEVQLNIPPCDATASSNSPVCAGDTIKLFSSTTALGTPTYSWTTTAANGFTSTLQNPTIPHSTANDAGVYTVAVTGLLCSTSANTTVVVNPLPIAAPTASAPFCDGTANLNLHANASGGTPGYGYSWSSVPSGFSSASSDPTITPGHPSDSKTYKVIVTDNNGCRDSATTTATVYALPPVTVTVIGSNNLCTGQTTSDLQASGAVSYLWSTTSTNSLITVSTQGTYSVIGTDVHSCVNTDNAIITESAAPAAPIVTPAGTVVLCTDGFTTTSVNLSVTNYSTSLLWSTSETDQTISINYADIFNVTYTDGNGCYSVSNPVSTSVDNYSTAPTGASSNAAFNNICLGSNVTLSVVGGSLGDNAQWKWYEGGCGSGAPIATGANPTITPATAGTHTYFVRSESVSCGNTVCASIAIVVSPNTALSSVHFTASTNSGCNGSSFTYSVNAVSGAAFYNWSVTSGALLNGLPGPIQTATNSVLVTFASPPPAGASGYNICAFAGNACVSSNNVCSWARSKVSVPAAINGSNIGCAGTNGTYTIATVAGADSYTWTVTGNATINGGTNTFTGTATSVTVNFLGGWTSGTLSVYASLNCGFSSTSRSMAISNTPSQPGAMSGLTSVCPNGGSASYVVPLVTGATSYNWTCTVPGSIVTPSLNTCSISFPGAVPAGSQVCVTAQSSCGSISTSRCKGIGSGLPGVPGNIIGPTSGDCLNAGDVSFGLSSFSTGATTYAWNVTGGATVLAPNFLSGVAIDFPANFTSGVITVNGVNACGNGGTRTLTVHGAPAMPPAITANPTSWCAGNLVTFSTAGSAGASDYSWVVSNGTILTPQGLPTIDALWGVNLPGTVSVTASNTCGTSPIRSQTFASSCREGQVLTSGITPVSVYPNPASDNITLSFYSSADETVQMTIADVLGRTVMSETIKAVEGDNQHEANLTSLAKGVYLIHLNGDNMNEVVKVTVE